MSRPTQRTARTTSAPACAWLLGIAALGGLLAAGCGYGSSSKEDKYLWASVYRQDVQTIAVPIFHNTTFTRGIEMDLTKAIIQQIETSTPYKVSARERADAVLEGEIVNAGLSTLSSDTDSAIPQEQILSLSVNFVFKDLRTGQVFADRRNFEQTATHYPTLGEGQFVSRQQAVERLAVAIVQELQADW
jgi:hypothetical protein